MKKKTKHQQGAKTKPTSTRGTRTVAAKAKSRAAGGSGSGRVAGRRKKRALTSRKPTKQPRKRGSRSVARAKVNRQRRATTRTAARAKSSTTSKPQTQLQSRSVANLAASVLSRRAAKVGAKAASLLLAPAPPHPSPEPSAKPRSGSRAKTGRHGSAKQARPHGAAALPGNRPLVKAARAPQFNYMKAPGRGHGFDVGDSVEVLCDHERDGERVRGWIKGVVVQVDNKLVAVQFRSNVFLTDGWMVPDRILWYSLTSDQIRNTSLAKRVAQASIPEY